MQAATRDTGLTFDEESHTYRINGQVVPSVTQVLSGAGLIDGKWFTEAGRTRGSYVALATELYDKDILDFDALDFELQQYVRAWGRFVMGFDVTVLEVEKRVFDATRRYAGTLDRVVTIGVDSTQRIVLDIKTGGKAKWHPLQTAAYAACLTGLHKRASIILKDDATFQYVDHGNCHTADRAMFYSALNLYHWKKEKGLIDERRED
jgi:hypothetical protein